MGTEINWNKRNFGEYFLVYFFLSTPEQANELKNYSQLTYTWNALCTPHKVYQYYYRN